MQVYAEAQRLAPGLRFTTAQPFFADPDYIEALHAVAQPDLDAGFDHLLVSFHGLPVRHLRKADSSHAHCQRVPDCCRVASPAHATCYRAQCFRTVEAFARRAGLPEGKYSLSFQSRLPGEPWLEPFTDRELRRLAQSGVRRLLVMSPAFTVDCLETLEELALTGRQTFLDAGGTAFKQIPCLNDSAPYVEFLSRRALAWQERLATG